MRQFTGNPLGDDFEEDDDDSILDLLDYDPEAIRFGPPESDSEDDIFAGNSTESENDANNTDDDNYTMETGTVEVGEIPQLFRRAIRTIRDTVNTSYEEFLENANSIETNPPPYPYNVDCSSGEEDCDEGDCDYVTLPAQEQNANKPAEDQTTSATSQPAANEVQLDVTG